MRSAAKRIVQDGDIARLEIEGIHRMPHRQRHGAEVHWHVIAHRHRFAGCIINRARIIAPLFDIGGIGSLAQHRSHLFGDGNQQMAKQLQLDRIGLHCLQAPTLTRKLATFCQRAPSDFSRS